MPLWVVMFMVLAGALFGIKLLYICSIGGLLPVTRGALFVSTSASRIASALDGVPMRPGDQMYDLGCGEGRVLRAAAKRYGVCAVGYEVNPIAYLAARALSVGRRDVRIHFGNFWDKDLSDADVIFCYLFPDLMERLAAKLATELRSGARVVSFNFPLSTWKPAQVLHSRSQRNGDPIYIYRA